MKANSGGGAVYGLGLIGALIHYLQYANTIQEIIFGIVKAILWPGFLIYKVLEVLSI
jgi:hypothetical protein